MTCTFTTRAGATGSAFVGGASGDILANNRNHPVGTGGAPGFKGEDGFIELDWDDDDW